MTTEEQIKQLQEALAKSQAIIAQQQQQLQEKSIQLREKTTAMDDAQDEITRLKQQLAWFRKKLFGKMSEKHLPLDPTCLEPTLFDTPLSSEEQAKLSMEVRKMEEENARLIEVRSHKREVRTLY